MTATRVSVYQPNSVSVALSVWHVADVILNVVAPTTLLLQIRFKMDVIASVGYSHGVI